MTKLHVTTKQKFYFNFQNHLVHCFAITLPHKAMYICATLNYTSSLFTFVFVMRIVYLRIAS